MKSRNVIWVVCSVAVVLCVCLIMTTAAGWLVYKDIFFCSKIYSLNVVAQYLTENFRLIIGVTVLITGVLCVFRFAKGIWGWAQNTGRVCLLLVGAVTVSFMVVYADYIWGGRFLLFTDMGMDTICQYYPTYAYLVSQLKAGTLSLWNFEWGLGCDLVNAYTWLMDPCAWAIVGSGVLFGEGIMKWMLPIMQLLKLLASSLLCFGYLGSIGFSAKARFTAAYLYAFRHSAVGSCCGDSIIILEWHMSM